MSGIDITARSNADKIGILLNAAYLKGLEAVGLAAEGYAKKEITAVGAVDTGHLRNSITHKVDDGDKSVIIGTNVEYGKYVELGTGRQTIVSAPIQINGQAPQAGNPLLAGMKARPFLRPAATEHTSTYNEIMQNALKKG